MAQFDRWLAATGLIIEARDLASLFDVTATGQSRQRQIDASRFAAEKLGTALRLFANRDTSAADVAMRRTIAQLQALVDRHFQVLQERLTAERPENLAQLIATEAQLQANVEKGWQAWLQNTQLVCDALSAPVPDGFLEHPRLTQVEREAIRHRLQQRFPSPEARAAGQDPLRASIGLWKQCLREE